MPSVVPMVPPHFMPADGYTTMVRGLVYSSPLYNKVSSVSFSQIFTTTKLLHTMDIALHHELYTSN